jgi:hypothetical protein
LVSLKNSRIYSIYHGLTLGTERGVEDPENQFPRRGLEDFHRGTGTYTSFQIQSSSSKKKSTDVFPPDASIQT